MDFSEFLAMLFYYAGQAILWTYSFAALFLSMYVVWNFNTGFAQNSLYGYLLILVLLVFGAGVGFFFVWLWRTQRG